VKKEAIMVKWGGELKEWKKLPKSPASPKTFQGEVAGGLPVERGTYEKLEDECRQIASQALELVNELETLYTSEKLDLTQKRKVEREMARIDKDYAAPVREWWGIRETVPGGLYTVRGNLISWRTDINSLLTDVEKQLHSPL
jgi:hypothetical protein